jgi:hypothetical protein
MHLTPEGFPSGIPGIGDDIDIAMQQAPQSGRQSMVEYLRLNGAEAQGRNGQIEVTYHFESDTKILNIFIVLTYNT